MFIVPYLLFSNCGFFISIIDNDETLLTGSMNRLLEFISECVSTHLQFEMFCTGVLTHS
jgi:hypothetical protein